MGARAAPEVAPAGPGGAARARSGNRGHRPGPASRGEIGMDGGEKGDNRAGEGVWGWQTPPVYPRGLGESGGSEPVTNVKSVLGEKGGGGGCSSVPECLFLRYLFISLSSGVMFELFSLSLDLSIISKIMKFPNVALSGCIPIPPSLFPILPAAPGTGVPGDVKTKTRGGAAGDGGEKGLCQPCQAPLLALGRGAQPFPPPGCPWTSPTSVREPSCEDKAQTGRREGREGGFCRDPCLQQNSPHHKNCVNSIRLFMGGRGGVSNRDMCEREKWGWGARSLSRKPEYQKSTRCGAGCRV